MDLQAEISSLFQKIRARRLTAQTGDSLSYLFREHAVHLCVECREVYLLFSHHQQAERIGPIPSHHELW